MTQNKTLFELMDEKRTAISFVNELRYNDTLNTYTFRNFYNGGGVGIADFNNDSLPEIFFTGNQVSNRLYLNKGDFRFEDISASAGLESDRVWTTGVSIADVNGDGYLDIYLCKSGPPGGRRRSNELFLNNGDLTFTEKAADFGLDFTGLSIHAAFFDYDHDGDLDCYLLNNSIRSVGNFDLRKDQRNIPDTLGGNKLLKNEKGKFIDVSQSSGIYSSQIGFGLGVTVGDINLDGWSDLYVSNDFFEKDYLYINNRDGTFTESLEKYVTEISMGSMGADMADINNDGYPEIFVTEMLPESDARLKTTSQFESWVKYQMNFRNGYFRQFSRNTLQLNNGDGTFSEVSRLANVHATDWSWSALIFDMDGDTRKDIFVSNGIYKDLIDQDYVNFVARPDLVSEMFRKEHNVIKRLIDSIPSNKLSNFAFKNKGDLEFVNSASEWGLAQPSHSNGSAYGDLDGDGDLDLVVSNVNMPAFIYRNRTREDIHSHYLTLFLKDTTKNDFAIGAKVTAYSAGMALYQEISPMRGFMSNVDYPLTFGLGQIQIIDSLVLQWPDGTKQSLSGIKADQRITIVHRQQARKEDRIVPNRRSIFASADGPAVKHIENDFNDFDRDRLLFNMVSNEGPCLCTGDVNGDGLADFYLGGAKDQSGSLFIQRRGGSFERAFVPAFEADKVSEDTDCVLADLNGDKRIDLYVTSGGNEFSPSSPALIDRVYFNKGKVWQKGSQLLPTDKAFESTSSVSAGDYDNDGDLDLFVGVRMQPFMYGVPGNGYVLQNDGKGNFSDVTDAIAPGLKGIGLITGSTWSDFNNDGQLDLAVTGEWMPVKLFIQNKKSFTDETHRLGLQAFKGWFNEIKVADVNRDGRMDIVAANHGLNSRFKASVDEPVQLYINDFDQNGTIEHVLTRYDHGKSLPLVLRHDLVGQIPALKKKYLHFRDYRNQTITDIFGEKSVANSLILSVSELRSCVFLNRDQTFSIQELPLPAQYSPMYSIEVDDFDGDAIVDIVMGGNLFRAKPETGIYAASFGILLKGDGNGGFTAVPASTSGLSVRGEIRKIEKMKIGNQKAILVAINNDSLQLLTYGQLHEIIQ